MEQAGDNLIVALCIILGNRGLASSLRVSRQRLIHIHTFRWCVTLVLLLLQFNRCSEATHGYNWIRFSILMPNKDHPLLLTPVSCNQAAAEWIATIKPASGDFSDLDFCSVGALVHRLDSGVVPFRKTRSVDIHVSGKARPTHRPCGVDMNASLKRRDDGSLLAATIVSFRRHFRFVNSMPRPHPSTASRW